jgi:hypothetical protein
MVYAHIAHILAELERKERYISVAEEHSTRIAPLV